jgi:hypothetical protein
MFPVQCKNLLGLFLFIFFFVSYTQASDGENDKLQFSGFATLGATFSDSDHHGYRKDVSSDKGVFSGDIDFKQQSLLGLQANWSISPNLDAVYQGVLRDLVEPSLDRYTTLAFLRYEVNAHWNIRVGRTAPDLFLLTEYRDVDFSYIWATAPNEVYGIIPYRSIDGVDVTYSERGLGGIFKTKLFTGSSEAEISGDSIIQEVKIEDIMGISFSFDHFNWIVHVKHSQVNIANEPLSNTYLAENISQVPDFLWPNSQSFAQSLLLKSKKVSYFSISGQYQWHNWLASASKNYVFNEPNVNEVALNELIQGTTMLMNFYSANQQTVSLGWRWDITNDIASSLQWNHTQVDETGSVLWLNKATQHNSEERINTFLLTLSMVF